MKQQYKFLSILLVAGLLTACGSDEPQGNQLPKGQYPLKVSASVGAPQSRSVGKDSWTGDGTELFAVRIGEDGRVAKYVITDAVGKAEAVSGSNPLYWDNTDKATVSAWLPYDVQTDVDISDQSTGFAVFDYLAATAEGQSYLAPVSLRFKHKMAKVRCVLKPGKGVTEADLKAATMKFAGYTSATFTEGTLSGSNYGWVTPTSDREVLLVPQNMTGKDFITIDMGGNEYVYTPADDNAGLLKESFLHQYTVTVNANGIEVTTVSGSEWTDGGSEDVPAVNVVETFTAEQVKIGDYVYTDGTFSDGGLRYRLEDGRLSYASVNPVDGKNCVGIVFHIRNASSPADDCQYSELQNLDPTGYVVSVDQNFSAFANQIIGNNDQTNTEGNIRGYMYSNFYYDKYKDVFSLYALEWCRNHGQINSTDSYNFTSWYLHSMAELALMRGESGGSNVVLDFLQSNLRKASGAQFENSDYLTPQFFGNQGWYVWSYNVFTGAKPGVQNNLKRDYRAVCAFRTK